MANRKLFSTQGVGVAVATAKNRAGGKAYDFSKEHELAQGIVTSCFNGTFYTTEEQQLNRILELAGQCSPEFVAKAAIYGREFAKMKDTPALMAATLMGRGPQGIALLGRIFPRVVTNTKMLMNFVQFVRSGKTGRRSFGSATKRYIREWLENHSGNQLFTGSIGTNPSLGDIIKMVHPKPETPEKAALYAYLIGRDHNFDDLPPKVQAYERFKAALLLKQSGKPSEDVPVPDVPFQMLASLPLTKVQWKAIALNMPWNALRMNLNTLARHGCFEDKSVEEAVVAKLKDPDEVRKNNVFPYQLMTAYQHIDDSVPSRVRNALQDAMEVAIENVPVFTDAKGNPLLVAVCIDTSGSMSQAVTGVRQGATSKTRCVDVAALVGSAVSKKNEGSILVPFDTKVHSVSSINPRDSVLTVANQLSRFGGGGTDCASAMRLLNSLIGSQNKPNLVIYVSDYESWYNQNGTNGRYGYGTGVAHEWDTFKRHKKGAKMVCIDLVPHGTTQILDSGDVMNIGGFSDKIWPAIERFVKQGDVNFVNLINETIQLDETGVESV